MTDKPSDSRRNAIRILAGGSGAVAAGEWVKPAISTVVVPVHARMSLVVFSDAELQGVAEDDNTELELSFELTSSDDPGNELDIQTSSSGVTPPEVGSERFVTEGESAEGFVTTGRIFIEFDAPPPGTSETMVDFSLERSEPIEIDLETMMDNP